MEVVSGASSVVAFKLVELLELIISIFSATFSIWSGNVTHLEKKCPRVIRNLPISQLG